ncbi:hypothetical protein F2P81_000164 [Scophthalmus maximus]|uniref:Uncharacterized protein n=1 Tax=Scophthalmus maximus TaxID=52904 RepID=A0A6A4TV33_SCOMX|nr:hypothetical protein F2P81_000164 [Scophthalmus maximus]
MTSRMLRGHRAACKLSVIGFYRLVAKGDTQKHWIAKLNTESYREPLQKVKQMKMMISLAYVFLNGITVKAHYSDNACSTLCWKFILIAKYFYGPDVDRIIRLKIDTRCEPSSPLQQKTQEVKRVPVRTQYNFSVTKKPKQPKYQSVKAKASVCDSSGGYPEQFSVGTAVVGFLTWLMLEQKDKQQTANTAAIQSPRTENDTARRRVTEGLLLITKSMSQEVSKAWRCLNRVQEGDEPKPWLRVAGDWPAGSGPVSHLLPSINRPPGSQRCSRMFHIPSNIPRLRASCFDFLRRLNRRKFSISLVNIDSCDFYLIRHRNRSSRLDAADSPTSHFEGSDESPWSFGDSHGPSVCKRCLIPVAFSDQDSFPPAD